MNHEPERCVIYRLVCHNLRRSVRHHDRLWFIYRHISTEEPANEPDERAIEPGNRARFRRMNPRIRRANPGSRERTRADRMPHPLPRIPACARLSSNSRGERQAAHHRQRRGQGTRPPEYAERSRAHLDG